MTWMFLRSVCWKVDEKPFSHLYQVINTFRMSFSLWNESLWVISQHWDCTIKMINVRVFQKFEEHHDQLWTLRPKLNGRCAKRWVWGLRGRVTISSRSGRGQCVPPSPAREVRSINSWLILKITRWRRKENKGTYHIGINQFPVLRSGI